jgi:hypothetical protein
MELMKNRLIKVTRQCFLIGWIAMTVLFCAAVMAAQETSKEDTPKEAKAVSVYSGMYSFLKEGEFVQVTVEDDGRVTGFISRYGDGDSDKGTFLDQFFKSGKIEGTQLIFTTKVVHGAWFEFKGTIERGDAKTPADEGYFVLKGSLTQSTADVNKKTTSHAQDVAFRKFPATSAP